MGEGGFFPKGIGVGDRVFYRRGVGVREGGMGGFGSARVERVTARTAFLEGGLRFRIEDGKGLGGEYGLRAVDPTDPLLLVALDRRRTHLVADALIAALKDALAAGSPATWTRIRVAVLAATETFASLSPKDVVQDASTDPSPGLPSP